MIKHYNASKLYLKSMNKLGLQDIHTNFINIIRFRTLNTSKTILKLFKIWKHYLVIHLILLPTLHHKINFLKYV